MESSRPLWRVVRPVLLAAAAATSWLAISATAASADSPTDRGPLAGQVLSTVTAIAAPDAAVDLPLASRPDGDAPAPGLLSVVPKLQPLAGAVTSRADALVAAVPVADVPVVGSALTLPPLTPVTDPVLGLADDAVSAVAVSADSAVASVVDGVGPVLGALTGPVAAVVTPPALPAVPSELPEVPSELPGGAAAAAPLAPPAAAVTGSTRAPSAGIEPAPAAAAAARGAVTAAASSVPCGQTAALNPAETPMMSLADDPADERAPAVPDPAPGVPGSGSGSGAPCGGNANPAWLSSFRLHLAGTLNIPARGDLLAPPSPVSFGPGSSPD
ncbi:hypothetical protein ABC337_05930 [Arthrobacter sp. 1P04PC]|uniref:hypothetical protein n=1 Tax=unclassified Arthrobacter TaxID=235627 RepID=UPI0039A3F003